MRCRYAGCDPAEPRQRKPPPMSRGRDRLLFEGLAAALPSTRPGPKAHPQDRALTLAGRDRPAVPKRVLAWTDSLGRLPRPQPSQRQGLPALLLRPSFGRHPAPVLRRVRPTRGQLHVEQMENRVDRARRQRRPPRLVRGAEVVVATSARIEEILRSLLEPESVTARLDGTSHTILPVGIPPAEGEALRGWVVRAGAASTIEIGLGYGISALYICAGLLANGHSNPHHLALDPNQTWRFSDIALQAIDDAGLTEVFEFHPEDWQLEEEGEGDELHHWAVLRLPSAPVERAFYHFVEF